MFNVILRMKKKFKKPTMLKKWEGRAKAGGRRPSEVDERKP
jgi:hypothetical protein